MELTKTNTNWNHGSYEANRNDFLLPAENVDLYVHNAKPGTAVGQSDPLNDLCSDY